MKCILFLFIFIAFYANAQDRPLPVDNKFIAEYSNVRDFTVSEIGDEAYFTVQSLLTEVSVILKTKFVNRAWSKPEIASFSGRYSDLEPYFSPDGLRLYFASNRPVDSQSGKAKDFDIWYVERSSLNAGWGEPINIGEPVNTKGDEFYPAVADNQNLYFTTERESTKGKDDIFMCRWENGKYSQAVSLSDSINSAGFEFNAYIAPNESFLIYTGYNRPGGLGSGDLYISFYRNGNWTQAVSLGEKINSASMDYCPYIHWKTKTLYFTSKRSSLPPPPYQFSNAGELQQTLEKYENGNSRIYKVPISNIKGGVLLHGNDLFQH